MLQPNLATLTFAPSSSAFRFTIAPVRVEVLGQERMYHSQVTLLDGPIKSALKQRFGYSFGSGAPVMIRRQAEPG